MHQKASPVVTGLGRTLRMINPQFRRQRENVTKQWLISWFFLGSSPLRVSTIAAMAYLANKPHRSDAPVVRRYADRDNLDQKMLLWRSHLVASPDGARGRREALRM